MPVPKSCGWWSTDLLAETIDTFRPDVVAMSTSHNEFFDRTHPSWEGVKPPGDPVFDRFLDSEWNRAATSFGSGGVPVLWTDSPCAQSDRFNPLLDPVEANRRAGYFNARLIPAVAAIGVVETLGFNAIMCPDGTFTNTITGTANARPDGFHLSDEAAQAAAETWLGPALLSAAGR